MADLTLKTLTTALSQLPLKGEAHQTLPFPAEWSAFSAAEWDQLVLNAHAQGLAPLLYWILSKSGKFSSIPETARNTLRGMYSATWMNNQLILRELETFARAFKQVGIPLLALKGACYALTIYPDIGLRPMGDLDVLIPAAMRSEAVRIARSLGYGDTEPEATPGLDELLGHHDGLQKAGSPSISLEIHYSLVADKTFRFAVPVDWFWEQTEPLITPLLKSGDLDLLMLTPAPQLLYAGSHAMLQHGGVNAPLRWFYDMDRLIRFYGERLDWNLLLRQAYQFEWGSALCAALAQTAAFFNTPIPEQVLISLSEHSDRYQKLVALKQTHPATHILEEYQKLLSLNWIGRFRLAHALIAPSPAYMRWRYHFKASWLLPAYYVFRWWEILIDGFRSLVSLFKKGAHAQL
jgi:hypothetical protein